MITEHCNVGKEDYQITAEMEFWLSELMDTYGEDVVWLAYSYVRDKHVAEDIAQNTFIKCYLHASNFRGDSAIKTWLYRITINGCKDYLRSAYFRRIWPTNLIQTFIKEHAPSTESVYMEYDQSDDLIESIYLLPSKYREVIMLYYFEDFKIKEMEQILGIKGNTIKTRLRKARKLLKEKVKIEKGGFPFE
ncbi:MAG TPA: sigma-70 family RNA polymerase sigma factor [Bacillaceae bacterium]